jgi:hypothetical protein
MPESEPRNVMEKFFNSVANILVTPTVWVREKIVEPNQKKLPMVPPKVSSGPHN